MSFLFDDVNNFIVGSEEGAVYTASRHGNKGGINESFEGGLLRDLFPSCFLVSFSFWNSSSLL